MMDRPPLPLTALCFPALILLGEVATASGPRVSFDCAATHACRDVTTAEFTEHHADEKLIEVTIPISLLSRGESANELIACFYRIENLERNMLVHDYQPQTTLASEVVGTIQVERKEGKSKSLGLTLNGGWEPYIKGTGTATRGTDKSESERFERVAPLDLLAASGTVRRGAGVYYKLRPSSQTSLEGAKPFTVVFRVPVGWRGGYVRLTCEANSNAHGDSDRGREDLNLGLYLEGDREAEKVAEHFANAGFELREIASTRQRDIRRSSLPTPLHQVAAAISVVDPKIPETWLRHALLSPVNAPPGDYLRHLPEPVRNAVNDYHEAKLQLHLLNGKEAWRVELLKPIVD